MSNAGLVNRGRAHRHASARLFVRHAAMLLGATLLCAGCGQAPREPLPRAEHPRPFDSPAGPGRRPHNLDESLRALEQVLPTDLQLTMKHGSERDMIRYWDDVGRWIRNSWILGNERQPLKEWFEATYGLHTADEISGVVMTSFWRYLNDRPLDVDAQIHPSAEQRQAWAREREAQQERMTRESAALNASRTTWEFENVAGAPVTLPRRRTDDASVTARYLAAYGHGVFVTSKYFRPDEWVQDQTPAEQDARFHTRCSFADLDSFSLRPVRIAEAGLVDQCVVINDAVFLHALRAGRSVIVRVSGNERAVVPVPPGTGWLRLGRSDTALLAVRSRAVFRFDGGDWAQIASVSADLPRTGAPPREFAGRVWFREEGVGFALGNPGRLAWLWLHEHRLRYYDEEVGWGHLWLGSRSISQFDVAPDGTVWIAEERLVLAGQEGTYRSIGVPTWKTRPSAISIENTGCALLVTPPTWGDADFDGVDDDPTGMSARATVYRACAGRVWPLFSIRRASQRVPTSDGELQWNWMPTHITEALREIEGGVSRCFVIGAEYGGLYVLTEKVGGYWSAHSLDEAVGLSIEF